MSQALLVLLSFQGFYLSLDRVICGCFRSIPLEFGEGQRGKGKSPADKHLDPAIVIPKGAPGERWGGTRDAPSAAALSKGIKSLDSRPSRPPAGLIPAGGSFPLTSLGKHSLLPGFAGNETLERQD